MAPPASSITSGRTGASKAQVGAVNRSDKLADGFHEEVGDEPEVSPTFQVATISVRAIALGLLGLLGLLHAVRAKGSNPCHVKAGVGANALVLEVLLVTFFVADKINVAVVRELADRLANGFA
ncbi:hypothetical protein PWT90_06933 [Aphanocladium album]|nr:hypothetical protein PWT90_06933 [Aphanocladium album]